MFVVHIVVSKQTKQNHKYLHLFKFDLNPKPQTKKQMNRIVFLIIHYGQQHSSDGTVSCVGNNIRLNHSKSAEVT
jgi:hypothetical protein